ELRDFGTSAGAEILEGHALSRTSPAASCARPGRTERGSSGRPLGAGIEMKVVDGDGIEVPTGDVGEIVIRGHNVMKGYWNRPDEPAAAINDGWFHTGDMAVRDEDGFFFIVDRKKDVIIRGGYTSIRVNSRRSSTNIPRCGRPR